MINFNTLFLKKELSFEECNKSRLKLRHPSYKTEPYPLTQKPTKQVKRRVFLYIK